MTGYRYKSVKNLNKSVKVRGYLLVSMGDEEYSEINVMGNVQDALIKWQRSKPIINPTLPVAFVP